jgi:DivIVA domain-containing protein
VGHGSNEQQDQSASGDVTPDEIAARRFPVVFRGYDRSEVGYYLRRVAAAHRAVLDELALTRAALDGATRGTSVVGVSTGDDVHTIDDLPTIDDTATIDARDIDLTDSSTGRAGSLALPGEDDAVFDRMVRDALDRAVRSSHSSQRHN